MPSTDLRLDDSYTPSVISQLITKHADLEDRTTLQACLAIDLGFDPAEMLKAIEAAR